MKFCLNLDDIDSEDDSLGVEVEGGFDGNMKTRELLSNEIPVRVQIGATGCQSSDSLDIPSSTMIDVQSEQLSCASNKKYVDVDSIADVIEELESGFDDLFDLSEEARDDDTAITPTMSNRTQMYDTGVGRVPEDDCKRKKNQKSSPHHQQRISSKEKMADLPNHLQSLLMHFSHAHRTR